MSLFPGEVGPYIYPRGQRSQTGSLGVPGVCMRAECVVGCVRGGGAGAAS